MAAINCIRLPRANCLQRAVTACWRVENDDRARVLLEEYGPSLGLRQLVDEVGRLPATLQ